MVLRLAASTDCRYLAAGAADTAIPIWDLTTGKRVRNLQISRGYASSLAFSPKGLVLAAGEGGDSFCDPVITLWNAANGDPLKQLKGHALPVTCLAFSRDGKLLVSGAVDGTVRLWDPDQGSGLLPIASHEAPIQWLGRDLNPSHWVTVAADNTLRHWDSLSRQIGVVRLRGNSSRLSCIAVSADQRRVVGGARDNSVYVWRATSGNLLHQIRGHRLPVTCVALSPDGKTIASGGCDGTVRLWDAATGRALFTLHRHESIVYSVAFSPDGRLIAALGDSHPAVHIWAADTGRWLRPQSGPIREEGTSALLASVSNGALAFSPDGRMLAIGLSDGFALREVSTGKERLVVRQTSAKVARVMFGPAEWTLLTGNTDGSIWLWETGQGTTLARFQGKTAQMEALALVGGSCFASAGGNSSALVWDASSHLTSRTRLMLTSDTMMTAWSALAGDSAPAAYHAIFSLSAGGDQAVSFIRTKLRTVNTPPERQKLEAAVADLDNPSYARRERAFEVLRKTGTAAKPALTTALAKSSSAEARQRIQALLEHLAVPSGEELRGVHVVEVLERIGTLEAHTLLDEIAKTGDESRVSAEATSASRRLRSRTSGPKP